MWNGSVPILQQWYQNKCKPVKNGNCGTLAAVMCTGTEDFHLLEKIIFAVLNSHYGGCMMILYNSKLRKYMRR